MPQFTISQREIGRGECHVGRTKCGVSFGQVFIEREGFARRLFLFAPRLNGRDVAVKSKSSIGVS
jgi:hypothetical protein